MKRRRPKAVLRKRRASTPISRKIRRKDRPLTPERKPARRTPTTAAQWIKRFGLQPHPEGGFYRELFRSRTIAVTRYPDGAARAGLTTILFLLKRGQLSRWHRVTSDESWHFHAGAPLELLTIDMPVVLASDTRIERQQIESKRLGPLQPVLSVQAGAWQAAVSRGAYTLVSCSVGPGFEFEDFRMLDGVPAHERPRIAAEFISVFERFR